MSEEYFYFKGYSDAHGDLMVKIDEDIEKNQKELDAIFDNYGKDKNVTKETQLGQMNQLIGQKKVFDLMRLYLAINNDGKKGCSIDAHLREAE